MGEFKYKKPVNYIDIDLVRKISLTASFTDDEGTGFPCWEMPDITNAIYRAAENGCFEHKEIVDGYLTYHAKRYLELSGFTVEETSLEVAGRVMRIIKW